MLTWPYDLGGRVTFGISAVLTTCLILFQVRYGQHSRCFTQPLWCPCLRRCRTMNEDASGSCSGEQRCHSGTSQGACCRTRVGDSYHARSCIAASATGHTTELILDEPDCEAQDAEKWLLSCLFSPRIAISGPRCPQPSPKVRFLTDPRCI